MERMVQNEFDRELSIFESSVYFSIFGNYRANKTIMKEFLIYVSKNGENKMVLFMVSFEVRATHLSAKSRG